MKTKIIKISFFSILLFAIIFNACEKLSQYYKIDTDKCTSCMKCVAVCGYGAIQVDSIYRTTSEGFEYETTVIIDPKKCVGCGECYNKCSYDAIALYVKDKYVDGNSGASRVK